MSKIRIELHTHAKLENGATCEPSIIPRERIRELHTRTFYTYERVGQY